MAVTFFVSYKRNDAETERLLLPLCEALGRFRYKPFRDVVDLDPGDDWEMTLGDSIESSDLFLLLLSPAAAQSDRVKDELRLALRNWKKKKKPIIIPIYINIDEPQNPAFQQILSPLHHLSWKSEEDTPEIAELIRRRVRKEKRPKLIAKTAAAVFAALLIVLFVHSMMQIAQLSNARSSVADALGAFGQLRAAERLLLPRAWLAGRWKPETLAAQALEEHAAPMLASTARKDVDHGLLLSAQAAVLRAGDVTGVAKRVYDEQHYDLLVTSIDAREEIAGRSLAVSSAAAEWRIAIGGRIWRCAEPIGQRPCVESPRRSRHPVVAAAAFDSQTLRLVGYSGEVTALDLRSGQESSQSEVDATFIAVDDGGRAATSFDHRAATGPSVTIDQTDPALPPRDSEDLGRLSMLAFGPCDGCITTLGTDGAVKVWQWSSAGSVRVLPVKAFVLAATRPGHRLAVISSAGDLRFYDANAKLEDASPAIELSNAESIAISPDGRHVAVVHGGNVTVFDDGAAFWTLTTAAKQPRVIAAAFAGNDHLVTRDPSDARIWRLRSTERHDLTPMDRWTEWRKKFGLGGAGVVTRED